MTDVAASETPITPRGIELGGSPPDDFDAIAMGRQLLRTARTATLATLDAGSGWPFVSLINVATDMDGAPIFLASELALHSRNMAADPRISLLLASPGKGDAMANTQRLTVSGRATRTSEPRIRRRFLARHPKSTLYADFKDFSFYRVEVTGYHPNGGFARAGQIAVADLACDLSDAAELIAGEEGAIAHMNEDHADAVELYATKIGGQEPGLWRLTGIDPDGLDLALGSASARIAFPERITTMAQLVRTLKQMAARARES